MENDKPTLNLEYLEDSVIYDIFYESSTSLSGLLLREERTAKKAGDTSRYEALHAERQSIQVARDSVKSDDISRQIELKSQWDKRASDFREKPMTSAANDRMSGRVL